MLKAFPKHPEYSATACASLRAKLIPALDVLEIAKPILLQRYQEAVAEKALIAEREREFSKARRREEEARALADRAAKNQEEARK